MEDKIWAYLHGELSDKERAQFEKTLASDSDLRQAVQERQETDTLLKDVCGPRDNN